MQKERTKERKPEHLKRCFLFGSLGPAPDGARTFLCASPTECPPAGSPRFLGEMIFLIVFSVVHFHVNLLCHLYLCVFSHLYISIYLCIYVSIYLSIYLSIHLFIYIFMISTEIMLRNPGFLVRIPVGSEWGLQVPRARRRLQMLVC